jgi:hypothetical protein
MNRPSGKLCFVTFSVFPTPKVRIFPIDVNKKDGNLRKKEGNPPF